MWIAVAVVLVIVIIVVAVGVYGGSLGIPGLGHSSSLSSQGSSLFTVLNVTLSTFPAIEDAQFGFGASAVVFNHNTVNISNTTVVVNSINLGTCTSGIQPGQQFDCKVGQSVACQNAPSLPYAVRVTVTFAGGATQSSTTTINTALTFLC